MNIPCTHAAERVEDGFQLGGLSGHPSRPPNVWHTYYFTKLSQGHGQKIIVNFKLNRTSIKVISKTVNETGGEFLILSNTALDEPCQTCISTKIIKLILNSRGCKEFITWKRHRTRWTCVFQQL